MPPAPPPGALRIWLPALRVQKPWWPACLVHPGVRTHATRLGSLVIATPTAPGCLGALMPAMRSCSAALCGRPRDDALLAAAAAAASEADAMQIWRVKKAPNAQDQGIDKSALASASSVVTTPCTRSLLLAHTDMLLQHPSRHVPPIPPSLPLSHFPSSYSLSPSLGTPYLPSLPNPLLGAADAPSMLRGDPGPSFSAHSSWPR